MPLAPDTKPAFFKQRVYQGSNGGVFPLPFHERISQDKAPHAWTAVHLENEWLRVVVLPELGGRIHIGYDKVAGYDFFYRNNVIKPALVGLAGPWISGGVEFNWPQHHRPATFLPTDFEIEHEADGAVTVWCSDHDPFTRMKGMHGIRLRPDSAAIEARVRLYNRTEETQTFLWWANVAAAVDENYQAFFPTDVDQVADHAKRATASYPAVAGRYYGVDYPAQRTQEVPDGDRLDWYRNITVPTSYMVTRTQDDFFGGYDHGRGAGFVHWADKRHAPGKKLWTWGDAPFGHAWDAALTDGDGPYIELMAGVFTDNQPDFSFLAPGETKTFSQFWYPIQKIGPVHQATTQLAVRLDAAPSGVATCVVLGVAAAERLPGSAVELHTAGGELLHSHGIDLSPGTPLVLTVELDLRIAAEQLVLTVRQGDAELIRWQPRVQADYAGEVADAASEPPAPGDVGSVDELFFIGQYLHQYRHATRLPEPYWREALRRDPGDVRCNTALAGRALWAGDLPQAEALLRTAIGRTLAHAANPADGEAHYRLGVVLTRAGRDGEAEGCLAKACWNSAWRVPAGFALAKLAARAGRFTAAAAELRQVLALDGSHLQAADLLVRVLRTMDCTAEAETRLAATLGLDPLDQWARDLAGLPVTADAPTLLDVALEYSSAGFADDALRVLGQAGAAAENNALGQVQVAPLVHYHRAMLLDAAGRPAEASAARAQAHRADRTLCQPSRASDVAALESALGHGDDALAAMLLGNWHYDKRRYAEAIGLWHGAEAAMLGAGTGTGTGTAQERDSLVIVLRNLGLAAHNVHGDGAAALEFFERARALAPEDAKLLFEYDQLTARLGASGASRLQRLTEHRALAETRDDLSVVYAGLLTDAGRAADARSWLLTRHFQPWEGGEGQALAAWDAANIALAEEALSAGDAAAALRWLDSAVDSPATLGEARHPLANPARLALLRGDALAALGRADDAEAAWEHAARFRGDFAGMAVQSCSEQSYYSVLALRNLGRTAEADELTAGIAGYLEELAGTPAAIDFFATSLPTMLLFNEDPQAGRGRSVALLREQLGLLCSLPA